jgi:cysteinylglycine-S-conjugate dipeptidase
MCRSSSSEKPGANRSGAVTGPGVETMRSAMREAYGREPVSQGQGGSIPLCNVFADTFPEAEIMLLGVEELTGPQRLVQG